MRNYMLQIMFDDPQASKKDIAGRTSKNYHKDISQVYILIRAMEAEGTAFP